MLTAIQRRQIQAKLEAEAERLRQSGIEGLQLATSRDRIEGDEADFSSAEDLHSTAMRLKDREKFLLGKVHAALRRIEAGDFGECESCGEPIGFARLLARPVATLCIECKESEEKDEKHTATETRWSSVRFE